MTFLNNIPINWKQLRIILLKNQQNPKIQIEHEINYLIPKRILTKEN